MRKLSHFEGKEPILEILLREIRFAVASKYIKSNSIVADFGCGYHGEFLNRISNKIKLGFGYDLSVNNSKNKKNIKLTKLDINKINSLTKNKFDYITTLAVLEHVSNPNEYIKRLTSKLKRNGKLIITTPHKRSKFLLELLSFKLGLVSKDEISDHKTYFTELTLKEIINKNKLKIIELKTFEFGFNLLCVVKK